MTRNWLFSGSSALKKPKKYIILIIITVENSSTQISHIRSKTKVTVHSQRLPFVHTNLQNTVVFVVVFTLGAGWKTLSCCAGGSDAYNGITTMGLQPSGRCLAMSRQVLARASISSWPVMKTKISWDGGASCKHTTRPRCVPVSGRVIIVHEHAPREMFTHCLLPYNTEVNTWYFFPTENRYFLDTSDSIRKLTDGRCLPPSIRLIWGHHNLDLWSSKSNQLI